MNMSKTNLLIVVLALALNVSIAGMLPSDQEPIRPYSGNPFYWQYKGKPILRMLTADLDIFRCTPDSRHRLLSNRRPNEAYATARAGDQYAVYFPDGGEVDLELSGVLGPFTLKWLDIENSRWQSEMIVEGNRRVKLAAPGQGNWAALILAR